MDMKYAAPLIVMLLMTSCVPEDAGLFEIDVLLEAHKQKFAPDKRVAIFRIEAEESLGKFILRGETNLPEAKASFLSALTNKGVQFVDEVKVLVPGYAIVNNSVANLRSNPKHSAELATQALLGMVLRVYKKEGAWYLVQTPDNYLAWTDAGALQILEDETHVVEYEKVLKVVFTEPFGFVQDMDGQSVSDITLGNVLELTDEFPRRYKVRYPDGREGFVSKSQAMKFTDWTNGFTDDPMRLVAQAKAFMGVPYLWGGTSFKGVDCSGFTKMVYLMNGRIIPRDASQQVHTGELIDETKDFDKLIKGDLLFFGTAKTDSTRERVTHVAMWIGEGKYIHAAGKVKINSMDPADPLFSEARYNEYLRTKRLLNHETDGISLISSN
jgi:hypothetical protein